MSKKAKAAVTGSFNRPVRILALIMAILVAGGTLTFVISFLINLFS